tara:strand:+ start:144 stop:326 length:183 start_codon:yes stop_codon:yes gene_type:complete
MAKTNKNTKKQENSVVENLKTALANYRKSHEHLQVTIIKVEGAIEATQNMLKEYEEEVNG